MPSMITSGQKEAAVDMIVAATRKASAEAIDELSASGVLNAGNFQRGILAQGNKVGARVKATVKAVLVEIADNVVGRLKRIFADQTIELRETDGKTSLAEAKDVFTGGIYGAVPRPLPGKPTKKTSVAVYEMFKDGTYAQVFGGFGENLERLRWQQDQVLALVCDHRGVVLRADGFGTFFLFTGDDEPIRQDKSNLLVAYVNLNVDDHPEGNIGPFSDSYVRRAKCQHWVVVPLIA